ncbi:hypothetical protein Poli38472_009542 [Pythium oligandrum]|uniref:Major facilitator superfamily (MFS) profile domain-containing protein n=1 Tax=Pythium oligandrum TaxID=41045 RepID=A0A8K1CEM9_PYTOL|nr:hypothetical protein Poli38472_009542 [Pythium oligandrum]|eukprot:TMW62049.1 hypothetical protein Poli38472_009542 [Pythium oligandrum]
MAVSMPKLSAKGVILVLCFINFLNYIDRGIIPGAPESFQHFMTQTLGIDVTEQNFYLGLLSSAFIASTATFSLIFGFLAKTYRPFVLITIGMSSWVVAVLLCGLSYNIDSYYLLLFGRVLSGVGEASFHCNAMPFINRHAPKENSTVWLGIFIASISVGMAAGYVYGAGLAASPVTWAGAFYIEAGLMTPAVLACWFCIPDELNEVPLDSLHTLHEDLLRGEEEHSVDRSAHQLSLVRQPPRKESFMTEWWRVFKNIPFSLVAFGHAAYTFTLSAFSIFAPVLLIGMGFFESETQVSLIFGIVVVVSGTIGTVVGGLLLDRMSNGNNVSNYRRAQLAVDLSLYLMIITQAFGLIMMIFTKSKFWFLFMLAMTFLFMSAVGPAETVAVMEMFPESRQAMAVAANTVLILLLGDLPAPVIIGWLKDTWAPLCGTVEIDGDLILNPECHNDRSGINHVLLFSVLWMIWAVLLWLGAKVVMRRRQPTKLETIESPVHVN